jgi:NAD(P)H-quinone oxidoreductase subunit 5
MALPMVSLTIFVLMVPLVMNRMALLPPLAYLNLPATALLFLSGLTGLGAGLLMPLSKVWSRSTQRSFRILHDLLAYDFYTERLYRVTVVFLVEQLSRFSNWFDRYVIDGLVNLVGMVSLFSGEGLKYSISGQSQTYILTIVIGVSLLGLFMTWAMW